MKYKAIIFDVDGTLILNKEKAMPSKKVTRIIAKASRLLHIGIATSRCFANVFHIVEHLNLSGPSILAGGGLIVDLSSRRIFREQALAKKEALSVYDKIQKIKIPFNVCHNSKIHPAFSKENIAEKNFSIFSPGLTPKLVEEVTNTLSHLPFISINRAPSWKNGAIDILITHVSATKQHGILEVAQTLGIDPHEIIGVGDGYNDFPLLMACGLRVAMGNAVDELKAIADYIAPSVEEDGVADIIEKFVLNS